ncbi:MAG: hypothetical protein LBF65_00675 [Holosporales bacterium]|jgi:hypothetical protein|nr:hypothetical protein [Holosporales bacterium]
MTQKQKLINKLKKETAALIILMAQDQGLPVAQATMEPANGAPNAQVLQTLKESLINDPSFRIARRPWYDHPPGVRASFWGQQLMQNARKTNSTLVGKLSMLSVPMLKQLLLQKDILLKTGQTSCLPLLIGVAARAFIEHPEMVNKLIVEARRVLYRQILFPLPFGFLTVPKNEWILRIMIDGLTRDDILILFDLTDTPQDPKREKCRRRDTLINLAFQAHIFEADEVQRELVYLRNQAGSPLPCPPSV